MNEIHSCSYFCQLPGCIKQQRDELREKFFALSDGCQKLVERVQYLRSLYYNIHCDEQHFRTTVESLNEDAAELIATPQTNVTAAPAPGEE